MTGRTRDRRGREAERRMLAGCRAGCAPLVSLLLSARARSARKGTRCRCYSLLSIGASLCPGAACIGQVAPVVISCGQSCAATSPGLAKEHTAMGAATSVKHCPRTTNQAESRRVLCIDGGFGISSLRRGSILSRFGLASSWLDDLIRARDTMSESRWPRGRPTGPVCSMDSLQLRPVVVVASVGVITPTSSG